jgi:hypothetical protein
MNSIPVYLAIVGYFLSLVTYVARIMEVIPKFPIVLGMAIVSLGYLFLLSAKIIVAMDKNYKEENKENPDVGLPYFKHNKNRIVEWLTFVGNLLLGLFFVSIFIIPQLTLHVRWYDVFAAFGYSSAIAPIPAIIPLISLVVYYFFGSVTKSWNNTWKDKLQIISRVILAIFYALSAAKLY